MIIKKYTAETKEAAMQAVMDELGPTAVVKTTAEYIPHGLKKLFKKPYCEITAYLDDTPPKNELSKKETARALFMNNPNIIDEEKPADTIQASSGALPDAAAIELRLNKLTDLIAKNLNENKNAQNDESTDEKEAEEESNHNVNCLKLVYNQLFENEVDEKYINQVISEIEPILKKDTAVENILANIYQKIVLKLGKTEVLDIKPGKAKYVFFIGPTGVGKTTTIAKLAANLKLEKKLNVALITLDTYRIKAVDQLRTYSEILKIPLYVVYNETELAEKQKEINNFDVVLVDTAGRSHRDSKQINDIERLLNVIPSELREVYLVLSVTTKYKDLLDITKKYAEIAKYRLIFTKLDETECLGNIFNIRMSTGAPLSYATFGQNVPNDISRIDAQKIAKQLLGGED